MLISWIYGLIIWIRNKLFDLNWIKSDYFNQPIISIGNITTGGTGKTPLVIHIAKIILAQGKTPGIISRGYGRKSKGMFVVHNGKKLLFDVATSGDEPFLIGKLLKKVPIIVSENRSMGIKKLLEDFSVDIVIMDDGFQHRKVKRDLNIITVSGNESFSNYKLLPIGKLREPLQNIKRADLLIYTKTENFPHIHSKLESYYKQDFIFCIFHPILMKYNLFKNNKSQIPDEPVFAFCGIADSKSFFQSIIKFGIKIKGKKSYRDHQNYNDKILKKLSKKITELNVKNIITTEKDVVKLPDHFINNFEIYIIKIDIIMNDEAIIIKKIDSLFIN